MGGITVSQWLTFLLAFLGGAGGVALINGIFGVWKWNAERKAKKEDKSEEDITARLDELASWQRDAGKKIDALRDGLKCDLLDRIIYLGQSYISKGEVSFDDRKRLRDMHTSYHDGLGGNGDADAIMSAVDNLPLIERSK